MSLSGKHIDISYIIERVYRDSGFDLEIKYDEVIEWVWDVLALVGTPQVMVDKVTDGSSTSYKGNTMPDPIEIVDNRGELPVDLYSITHARDYDSNRPRICKSSPFLRDTENLIYTGTSQYTYTITGSYMYTSFEEGSVELHYKAFPTSATGMPLVPDDIKFIMATQSYIAERIAFRLWIQDKLTKMKYDEFKQERMWYIGAAQTKAQIPSLDEMEAIKNRFLRLKINPNFHDASFIYAHDTERLILHNNSGR